MREVSREWLEFLREQYPKGSRVRLTKMGNDPHPIPPGSMGTLKYIDDVGQFHVKWDNGRGLALIIGEDQFQILPPEPQTIKFYMPLTAQLYAYDDWGDLEEYGNDLDGRESITLKRLRDLTESVDCCHVVESVVSDGQIVYLDPTIVSLREGDRVRIVGGVFSGVEGIFIRIKGDRRVVVSIEGIMAVATAFVHPSLIEPVL